MRDRTIRITTRVQRNGGRWSAPKQPMLSGRGQGRKLGTVLQNNDAQRLRHRRAPCGR